MRRSCALFCDGHTRRSAGVHKLEPGRAAIVPRGAHTYGDALRLSRGRGEPRRAQGPEHVEPLWVGQGELRLCALAKAQQQWAPRRGADGRMLLLGVQVLWVCIYCIYSMLHL